MYSDLKPYLDTHKQLLQIREGLSLLQISGDLSNNHQVVLEQYIQTLNSIIDQQEKLIMAKIDGTIPALNE